MKTVILAVVLAIALMLAAAGCGGGSKGGSVAGMPSGGEPSTPTPQTYGPGTVPLPTGHTLETGTLPVGGSRTVGETDGMETVIRCTAGSENCRFTVAADGTVTLIAGSLRIEIVGIRVTPLSPRIPVVGDFPSPEGTPPGGTLPLPSEGSMDLWEGSTSSLVWSGFNRSPRFDYTYKFITRPLSFTGTYEGKAFLHYKRMISGGSYSLADGRGDAFLHRGTASLYYDGNVIDVTIDIPGEFNHTWENFTQYSTRPMAVLHQQRKIPSSFSLYDSMIVKGDEYGYGFDNLGSVPSMIGFTSGLTAGGYFGFLDYENGKTGDGVWGVSYSDSSRTPAPELSHCSTEPHKSYYCRPLTWASLPTLIDNMNTKSQFQSSDFPGRSCVGGVANCKAAVKELLAAAKPTGTMKRFQGTRTVQTDGGDTVTGSFWGGWNDYGSIFIAESIAPPETEGTRHMRVLTMGMRRDTSPSGVYRGSAVDTSGNWGTSELTYTGGHSRGRLSATINIPAHGDRAVMRWSNIPVRSGNFDNGIRWTDKVVGPNKMRGHFYRGHEVGGIFVYRWTLARTDSVYGSFGAKRTPDEP